MRDISTKADNVGDTLAAADFNANNGEVENVVTSTGETLDPAGGPDVNQEMLAQAIAMYAQAGQHYADSGSVNAYVLGRSSSLATVTSYIDGQCFGFVPGTANTGAATANVSGIGVKSITDIDGNALVGGELKGYCVIQRNTGGDRFHLIYSSSRIGNYNIIIDSGAKGDFTSIASYLAGSPAAGDRVLMRINETITGTLVVPDNVLIHLQKGKAITVTTVVTPVVELGDGSVLEGDFKINTSHTGTIAKGLSVNGDGARADNVIIENTTSGVLTSAVFVEVSRERNLVNAEAKNTGAGNITRGLDDSSGKATNEVVVRGLGGVTSGISVVKSQGDCKLDKFGFDLRLSRHHGISVSIDGVAQVIPASGVLLVPSGLTSGLVYYIYVYMNSGVMTLEASTTGHSPDTVTGAEIKTGDSTRALVGMERATGATIWQGIVRSWFNDPGFYGQSNMTTNRATSSTSTIEIHTEMRVYFLVWTGEKVWVKITGSAEIATVGAGIFTHVGFSLTPEVGGGRVEPAGIARSSVVDAFAITDKLLEDYNFATMLVHVSSAFTATFNGSAAAVTSPCTVSLNCEGRT